MQSLREPLQLGYSGDSNLLLHVLGDVESGAASGEEVPLMCNHCESPCSWLHLVLGQQYTVGSCVSWSGVISGKEAIFSDAGFDQV